MLGRRQGGEAWGTGGEGQGAMGSSNLHPAYPPLPPPSSHLLLRGPKGAASLHSAHHATSQPHAPPLPRYINCMDGFGWTPLHYAALNGREEVAALLLVAEDRLAMRSQAVHSEAARLSMGTPLHIVATSGDTSMIKLLLWAHVRQLGVTTG